MNGQLETGTRAVMRSLVLLALAVVPALSAASAAELPPSFEKYQCDDGSFRALVPSAWEPSGRTPPYADMTPVSGREFLGPAGADGVPTTISLYHYSGEGAFVTPNAYIRAQLGSPVRVDAEQGRGTSAVQVAGRQATAFRMRTFELVSGPPARPIAGGENDPRVYEIAPVAKKVIMEEQHIVLPASKGYFVLHYRAPEAVAERYRPIFEQVVATFEPLGR
jgi:hypothetical protein